MVLQFLWWRAEVEYKLVHLIEGIPPSEKTSVQG